MSESQSSGRSLSSLPPRHQHLPDLPEVALLLYAHQGDVLQLPRHHVGHLPPRGVAGAYEDVRPAVPPVQVAPHKYPLVPVYVHPVVHHAGGVHPHEKSALLVDPVEPVPGGRDGQDPRHPGGHAAVRPVDAPRARVARQGGEPVLDRPAGVAELVAPGQYVLHVLGGPLRRGHPPRLVRPAGVGQDARRRLPHLVAVVHPVGRRGVLHHPPHEGAVQVRPPRALAGPPGDGHPDRRRPPLQQLPRPLRHGAVHPRVHQFHLRPPLRIRAPRHPAVDVPAERLGVHLAGGGQVDGEFHRQGGVGLLVVGVVPLGEPLLQGDVYVEAPSREHDVITYVAQDVPTDVGQVPPVVFGQPVEVDQEPPVLPLLVVRPEAEAEIVAVKGDRQLFPAVAPQRPHPTRLEKFYHSHYPHPLGTFLR